MDIIVMLLNWSATNPRLLELPVAVTRSKSSLLLTPRAAPLIMWKRCLSYNCEDNGKCGKAANDVVHPPAWQYVLVGLGIVICKCQIPLSQSELSLTFFFSFSDCRRYDRSLVYAPSMEKRKAGHARAILQWTNRLSTIHHVHVPRQTIPPFTPAKHHRRCSSSFSLRWYCLDVGHRLSICPSSSKPSTW